MRFNWHRSHHETSALEDLVRAIEYAESRAATASGRRITAMGVDAGELERSRSTNRDRIDDSWPPYGRGV